MARIDWKAEHNIACVRMLAMGISPKVVAHACNLTECKVQYRGRQSKVKCSDWRRMDRTTHAGKQAHAAMMRLIDRHTVIQWLPRAPIGKVRQVAKRKAS